MGIFARIYLYIYIYINISCKGSHKNFRLKEPYFWPNIATNLKKKNTAMPSDNIILQDRKIFKVKYVSGRATEKNTFFVASLSKKKLYLIINIFG